MNERDGQMEFNYDDDGDGWEFEDELSEMLVRGKFERNVESLLNKVEQLDLPDRVIHPSREQEQALLMAYVNRYFEQEIEELYAGNGTLTHHKYRQMVLECFESAYDKRELQAEIVNMAAMLQTAAEGDDEFDGLRLASVEIAKKQYQAELRVLYRLKKNDKWLQFFDTEVPAPGLHSLDHGDIVYVDAAEDYLAEFERIKAKKRQVISEARVILGVDVATDDLDQVLDVTGDLINLHTIASAPVNDDETKLFREAQIRIFIAGCNLTDDLGVHEKLIKLFNDFYPPNVIS